MKKLALMAALVLAGACLAGGFQEQIEKDRDASIKYLTLKLQQEERLVKRGADDLAAKIEGECLRHEIKTLERYLWYVKRDKKLASKAKALTEAIAEMKKKDAKTSLEDRKKAGFKVADLVAEPLK